MKLEKFRKGQMAIVMTLAIATLLGVMALCTDVGVMYYIHMQLQKGADAAALAGAKLLIRKPSRANLIASTTTGFNGRNGHMCNYICEADEPKIAACTYAVNNNLATDAGSMQLNEAVASAQPRKLPIFRSSP